MPPRWIPITLLLVGGCRSTTFEEVRSECGIAPGQFVPLTWGVDGVYREISSECASGLIDAMRVDWSTFRPTPPTAIGLPVDVGEEVVAGLHTLIFSEQGTLGEMVADAGEEEGVIHLWDACDPQHRLDAETPMGEFWYTCVRDQVTRIRAQASRDEETASFEMGIVNLRPEGSRWSSPVDYAAIFAHETSHCCTLDHEDPSDSPDGFDLGDGYLYDPDTGRAFSVAARMSSSWLVHNQDAVDTDDAHNASYEAQESCARIQDQGNLADECAAL